MANSRSLQQAVRFALATITASAGVATVNAQTAPAQAADATAAPLTEVVLNNLPMVFAGENSTTSNGADGTATIDLRGLGNQRTLVLVNGRRLGPGAGDGRNYSDINEIPAALIERVDILTGGASSVYGADAVAGVVNFVRHFGDRRRRRLCDAAERGQHRVRQVRLGHHGVELRRQQRQRDRLRHLRQPGRGAAEELRLLGL